jgi:hypothetical protein
VAENQVVKEQLTRAMEDAGDALTRELDKMGVSISTALWLFDPEIGEWRLLFASSSVSEKGRLDFYEKIQRALKNLGPLASATPLSTIRLMDPGDSLVQLLKVAIQTAPDAIGRIRFSRNTINGYYIDDALIYRVT